MNNQQAQKILLQNATHKHGKMMTGRGKRKTQNKKYKQNKQKGGFSFGSLAGCAEDEVLAHGLACPMTYRLNPLSNPMGCCIKKTKPAFQLGGVSKRKGKSKTKTKNGGKKGKKTRRNTRRNTGRNTRRNTRRNTKKNTKKNMKSK
jgi:hypothetical protein